VVASTLLFLLSACSGADEAGLPQLRRPVFDQPSVFTDASSLPFDAFRLSEGEARRAQELQVNYLQPCLGKLAHEVELYGDFTAGGVDGAEPRSWFGPPGTMGLDHAAQFGYGPGPDNPGALGPPVYLKSLTLRVGEASEAGLQALYGDPGGSEEGPHSGAGGCMGSLAELVGAPLDDESFLDLERDLILRSFKDERVERAQASWSDCMRRAGFEYQTPLAAAADFHLREATAREVGVAVADVGCTRASNWSNVFLTILEDYQAQTIENDPERFSSMIADQRRLLKALETVS
jgi:hypothetical protein